MNGVAVPALAEVQEDEARFATVLLTATAVVFAVCSPAFLGAAAVGTEVIPLLFGAQWSAAAPVFSWLAAGGLLALVVSYNDHVFVIRNRPGWTLSLALLNVVTTLLGFVVFAGGRGAPLALPFVLPYVLLVPISMLLVHRVTGVSPGRWARAVLPPLLASGLMVLAIRFAASQMGALPGLVRLALLVAGGALIYGVVLGTLSRGVVIEAWHLVRRRAAAGRAAPG